MCQILSCFVSVLRMSLEYFEGEGEVRVGEGPSLSRYYRYYLLQLKVLRQNLQEKTQITKTGELVNFPRYSVSYESQYLVKNPSKTLLSAFKNS